MRKLLTTLALFALVNGALAQTSVAPVNNSARPNALPAGAAPASTQSPPRVSHREPSSEVVRFLPSIGEPTTEHRPGCNASMTYCER